MEDKVRIKKLKSLFTFFEKFRRVLNPNLLFLDAPHRRVNGGLGDPPGATIPGTTFSHLGQGS